MPTSSQSTLPRIISNSSISAYSGELKTESVIKAVKDIKSSFPSLPPGFYDIFSERVKANGFSDQRLKDAVSHVIDNCRYPTPTIADFISFDKRIKTYSYREIAEMVHKGEDVMSNYKAIKFKKYPKYVWIHVNDVQEYGIKDEE